MLSWIRSKLARPIYVDCYTTNPAVFDFARVAPATKFIPDWWKSLSPTYNRELPVGSTTIPVDFPTMKGCAGFIDLYKNSFCLPMWSELKLQVGPEGSDEYGWVYADNQSYVHVHPVSQRGSFMPSERYQHFKLISPWLLRCEEEVNFLLFDPLWAEDRYELGLVFPAGVVNYKYQPNTNINVFVRKAPDSTRNISIPYNTPLVFIAPLTERKVILRHHLITQEEAGRFRRPMLTFAGDYRTAAKTQKGQENG